MTHPSIRRKNALIPWGYTQNEDVYLQLDPIEELLDCLDQAKDLVKKGCSYRDVAKWLQATTEVPLTHVGLYLRIKADQKKIRSARSKEAYLRKYKPELFDDNKQDTAATTQAPEPQIT